MTRYDDDDAESSEPGEPGDTVIEFVQIDGEWQAFISTVPALAPDEVDVEAES